MSLLENEYQALGGIPGNIAVFCELKEFFDKYDVMEVKERLTAEIPEFFQESWLWYIHKYLCKQNFDDTLYYLQNIMKVN